MADVEGLRAIYNQVMVCKPIWGTNWHDNYQKTCTEVRERANRPEKLGTLPGDAEFLERLIRELDNGIASRGQSIMSREFFQFICDQPSFLAALEAMMRDPSSEKYTEMRNVWEKLATQQGVRRTPLLVNRVAAACTTKVSSTVDEGKFEDVYGWLIRMGLIDAPATAEAEANWYTKNCYLMKELQQELEAEETDSYWLSIFVWLLYDELCSPFALKKQVVKYGPPGTGKTYQARLQAQKAFGVWFRKYGREGALSADQQIETVQFHSSYGYESFIEGLQPVREKNGTIQLKLCDGTFKAFCKKAAKWEIDAERLKACAKSEKAWRDLTVGDVKGLKDFLAPGELGTHWDYILKLDPGTRVADAVPPFFFIIDEINRADLSRVFGELMYCLEYRGVEGALQTQYARLNDAETGMIKVDGTYRFFVPENVYLIGTMNTIDRSVESFDFALRRRFSWESVEPDMGVLRDNLSLMGVEKWSSLADSLERLNAAIEKEKLLGPDYRIGHAYLMNLGYPRSMPLKAVREAIWEDSIKPLLEEYLRGTGKEDELLKSFADKFKS